MIPGDHYGFTWFQYGVIQYDLSDAQNYCEDKTIFSVNNTAELYDNRYGNREYSLRFAFGECKFCLQKIGLLHLFEGLLVT